MLAVSASPARRDSAQGNLLPRRLLGADHAANHSGHFEIPRRMVRLPRLEIDRHLSSGVPAAQSGRERRSLEGFAEGNGRPRARTRKEKMMLNLAVWLFGRRGVAPLRPARILGFATS